MKLRRLIDSFNYAVQGIIHTLSTQKNMRIHFFIAIFILVLSLFFDLSRIELLILFLSITFVFVLEMINTAIETAIDLYANYYHPLAKIAKNVAAGAVLIAALNAVLVGYLLFFDKLKPITDVVVIRVIKSPPHITFIILMLTVLGVIGLKALKREGTPFKGGMPSGHSAIAFSAATIISLITKDTLVITLSFFMALLVAQTRIEAKIHSGAETFMGGLLGTLITLLFFQLF
ncbi:undecaprenol kinase [Oxobacter pfennigii]|uniref:Undecaprenol kinase n=1 Tax=Oxobacter pfennigii TaxID=36849 RepID=A0A0P8X035_9CLOT|nr:diacylglycerol kinase [Oxobacter pfennigii]KPU44109.1 undecaprenol kinase [Oxobacter pfennigii]